MTLTWNVYDVVSLHLKESFLHGKMSTFVKFPCPWEVRRNLTFIWFSLSVLYKWPIVLSGRPFFFCETGTDLEAEVEDIDY